MKYVPAPLAGNRVHLNADMLALVELLAQNTHEIWAKERLRQKWRFGPKRDDKKKEHPRLVPYDKLPGAEKNVDRQVAKETIKAILALGYRIVKK
jgi:ryanodine receptor 2